MHSISVNELDELRKQTATLGEKLDKIHLELRRMQAA
jgi:hypothetical protein